MAKKRTRPVTRKQIARGPKTLKLRIKVDDRELILHGDTIWEQVDDYPAWVKIGEVICRIP